MMNQSETQIQECDCGFKVRYGPEHAGRTVRCKDCGEPIALAELIEQLDAPLAMNDFLDDSNEYDVAPPEVKLPSSAPIRGQGGREIDGLSSTTRSRTNTESRREQIEARRAGGFWGDAGRAFVFWMKPGNAATFAILLVMLIVSDLLLDVPLLGLITWVIVTGMAWAFYLQIVVHTAGGDDDLPDPANWEGVIESVFMPLIKLVCVTIALSLPFLLASMFTNSPGLVLGLAVLSAFLWPVAILVTAIGGALAAFRLDALVMTVVHASLPYLAIWALLIAAVGAQFLAIGSGLGTMPEAASELIESEFFWMIVGNFTSAYTMIVMMITIGLFYRHYSDRFPWSAG